MLKAKQTIASHRSVAMLQLGATVVVATAALKPSSVVSMLCLLTYTTAVDHSLQQYHTSNDHQCQANALAALLADR